MGSSARGWTERERIKKAYRQKKWYKANREHVKAYKKKWDKANRERTNASWMRWYWANHDRIRRNRRQCQKKFRLKRVQEFGADSKGMGLCPICGEWRRMYWDHDHTTGLGRGMLCNTCNSRLEWFIAFKDTATRYMERS